MADDKMKNQQAGQKGSEDQGLGQQSPGRNPKDDKSTGQRSGGGTTKPMHDNPMHDEKSGGGYGQKGGQGSGQNR